MIALFGLSRPTQLESPNVVPQFDADDQAGLCEFDQIAINGRAIKSSRPQSRGHLRVRNRTGGLDQLLHHPQSSRRAAESRGAQSLANFFERRRERG